MALVVADRVKDTTTTTGTGTVTLSGTAPTGFQSFAAIGDGNTTYYTITLGAEWEVGIGTYTASGTTLSRDTVLDSSNSGSLVNFSAGTKEVFVTYPADKSISDGYGTLPTGNGGTGLTATPTNGQLLIGNGSGYTLATLTAGTGINVTNGSGSITIAADGGGTGDVVGPASATDNAIVRFDGTTGKLIQNSAVTISDTGELSADWTATNTKTFQSNTGLSTYLSVFPPSGGSGSRMYFRNNSDPSNSGYAYFGVGGGGASTAQITTGASGSGTAVNSLTFTLDATNPLTLAKSTFGTNASFGGAITEEVFALTGTTPALAPEQGTIQTWTLTGNSTPTDSFSAGQSMTLMVDDGTAYTITWPSVTWVGGTAPTLATSGYTVVELWKVGSTLYGAHVGDVA